MSNQQARQCCVCYDEDDLHAVYNSWICVDCLKKWFQSALDDQQQYPVRMQGRAYRPIHMADYQHLFDPHFVAHFQARERQLIVPPWFRLFCSGVGCGYFFGDSRTVSTDPPYAVCCPLCSVLTCICHKPYTSPSTHDCTPKSVLPAAERGITWQQCPNDECRAEIAYESGCHEMSCNLCRTNYW